jgi:hypothetical protein
MAAGDVVASISGLGSALRSDCEAGLPTETGSGLIGAAFDILRRKVPSPSRSSQGGPLGPENFPVRWHRMQQSG